MPEIRKEITIEREIETVFAYISDAEKIPERLPTTTEARLDGGGTIKLGSRIHTVSEAKGRRHEIEYEVSRYELNKVFATKITAGAQPFEEIFELEAVEGGTKVSLTANGDMPGVMKLFSGRFKKLLKRQVGNDLERLKELLEEQQAG